MVWFGGIEAHWRVSWECGTFVLCRLHSVVWDRWPVRRTVQCCVSGCYGARCRTCGALGL